MKCTEQQNKELKNEKPENLQYKSKLNGEWKNMREKDRKDCFELFDMLGYEIRLNPLFKQNVGKE